MDCWSGVLTNCAFEAPVITLDLQQQQKIKKQQNVEYKAKSETEKLNFLSKLIVMFQIFSSN